MEGAPLGLRRWRFAVVGSLLFLESLEPFLLGSHLEDNLLLERGPPDAAVMLLHTLSFRRFSFVTLVKCSRCCIPCLLDAGRRWCFVKLDGGWGRAPQGF